MSLFGELKRRNVIRVAMAYLAASWLLIGLASIVFPALGAPGWGLRALATACVLGFVPVLILSWMYALTPGGLVRDTPVTHSSARPVDVFILTLVLVALALIVTSRIWQGDTGAQIDAHEAASVAPAPAPAPSAAEYPPNSIAVLPFVNMSDDEGNEYFSDGISEELLNLLSRVHELRVISRSSAFSLRNTDLDIQAIAAKLNVAYVLEGSVRKSGDRVRITAQLIDARTDTHRWSETYDRTLDDIFAIQDEIADMVVEQLKIMLLGEAPRSAQIEPRAYALYLQARYLGRQLNAGSLERSNDLYRQSLDLHPDNAAAWSGLATNYVNQAIAGLKPFEEFFGKAREAAQAALAIDPRHAPAHANLGWIAFGHDNDLALAALHYEQALKLDPRNTYLIRSAAVLMRSLNRADEAIRLGEYATVQDPLVASGHHNLGIAYLFAGRWDEAIASQQTVLRLSPGYLGAQYRVGVALLFKGDAEAALEAFALEGDEEYRVKGRTVALHALGRQDESLAGLAELIERWGAEWPSEVAHVYAFTGDADAAFKWLDKAIELNEEGVGEQIWQPYYRELHADPRWAATLQRMGSSPEELAAIRFDVALPD